MATVNPQGVHIEAALTYARRGWPVCPLHWPTTVKSLDVPSGQVLDVIECSCRDGANCRDKGKHPRWLEGSFEHGLHDATVDEATIRQWWSRWPEANIAIRTGAAPRGAGWVVLDVDPRHGGDDALAELEAAHGGLPTTIEALTGGGGRHVLFAHPGRTVPNKQALAPGLDIRGDDGYIVAAPSSHASGRAYAWDVGAHPDDTAIAAAPEWLLRLIESAGGLGAGATTRTPLGPPVPWVEPPGLPPMAERMDRARVWLAAQEPSVAGAGGGPHTMHVATGLVRGFALDLATALDLLGPWNDRCSPPWDTSPGAPLRDSLERKVREAIDVGRMEVGAKLMGGGRVNVPEGGVGMLPRTATPWGSALPQTEPNPIPPNNIVAFPGTGPATLEPGWERGPNSKVAQMLRRYVLLYGTLAAWDLEDGEIISLPAMKAYWCKQNFTDWDKDLQRKAIKLKDLVFAPQGCDPGQINIFRGLNVKPPPAGATCERILMHFTSLCGNDLGLLRWVLCWFALPLQRPGTKMQTAIVIHGAQGTGKNLAFVEIPKRIYDQHFFLAGQTQINSTFTDWLSRKLFIVFNEVATTPHERRAARGFLKALITDSQFPINEKFKPTRSEENHVNVVFLSNEPQPVELDKDDRRHTVIRFDDVRDDGYYTALVHEIENGGTEAFYQYLMAYDLGDFGPATKPYATQAKQDLIALSKPPADAFLEEWLAGQTVFPAVACKASALWHAFEIWCKTNNQPSGKRSEFVPKAKKVAPDRYADLAGDDRTRIKVYQPQRAISIEAIRLQCDQFETVLDVEHKRYHGMIKL